MVTTGQWEAVGNNVLPHASCGALDDQTQRGVRGRLLAHVVHRARQPAQLFHCTTEEVRTLRED